MPLAVAIGDRRRAAAVHARSPSRTSAVRARPTWRSATSARGTSSTSGCCGTCRARSSATACAATSSSRRSAPPTRTRAARAAGRHHRGRHVRGGQPNGTRRHPGLGRGHDRAQRRVARTARERLDRGGLLAAAHVGVVVAASPGSVRVRQMAGVLLTGGASRRMGVDKARLVVNGETLAARGRARARRACAIRSWRSARA